MLALGATRPSSLRGWWRSRGDWSIASTPASQNRRFISLFPVRLLRVAATLIANSPLAGRNQDTHGSAAVRGMPMLKLFITVGCLCAATLASAQPVGLSGPQIRALVAGAWVEIDTPLGIRLPIHYA